jgi:hypothetical protein
MNWSIQADTGKFSDTPKILEVLSAFDASILPLIL